MAKTDENKCERFAEIICDLLGNGLTLGAEAVHFIDSTFAAASVQTLQEVMIEEADGDMEVLYALIFFPDITLQEQLEPVIENCRFDEEDEAGVVTHLVDRLPETLIHFPDNRGVLQLTLPESVAGQFVSRLHILKRLDRRLIESLRRHMSEDQALQMKVKLRNTRFEASESRISFLSAFFEKVNDDAGAYVDLILSIFEESRESGNIYELLQSRKKNSFLNLQKAIRYQKMLNAHNMETLMLRGIRIPHIDAAEEEKKMHLIDGICQAVYGKTEHIPATEDVLEFRRDVNTQSNASTHVPSLDGRGKRGG